MYIRARFNRKGDVAYFVYMNNREDFSPCERFSLYNGDNASTILSGVYLSEDLLRANKEKFYEMLDGNVGYFGKDEYAVMFSLNEAGHIVAEYTGCDNERHIITFTHFSDFVHHIYSDMIH